MSVSLQLDNYEIREGKLIGVCKSHNNVRIFVGNIPKNKGRDELKKEFEKFASKSSTELLEIATVVLA